MNDLEITAFKLEMEAAEAIGKNVEVVRDKNGNVIEVREFPNNETFKNCVFNYEL